MKFNEAKNQLSLQGDIGKEKAHISGRVSFSLEGILNRSISCLNELKKTSDGRVNEETIRQLAEELNIEEPDLEENFNEGLSFNIKAAYKISLLDNNSTDEDIKYIIGAYTLSFRSALSNFKRFNKDESASVILWLAKRSYLLPSSIFHDIQKKYKDNDLVDDGMIKRFTIHNPKDPEGAIEHFLYK